LLTLIRVGGLYLLWIAPVHCSHSLSQIGTCGNKQSTQQYEKHTLAAVIIASRIQLLGHSIMLPFGRWHAQDGQPCSQKHRGCAAPSPASSPPPRLHVSNIKQVWDVRQEGSKECDRAGMCTARVPHLYERGGAPPPPRSCRSRRHSACGPSGTEGQYMRTAVARRLLSLVYQHSGQQRNNHTFCPTRTPPWPSPPPGRW